MAEQREQRCETCRFWEVNDVTIKEGNDDPFGTCHRWPPSKCFMQLPLAIQKEWNECADKTHDPTEGFWPATKWHGWFGEWQPITPANPN